MLATAAPAPVAKPPEPVAVPAVVRDTSPLLSHKHPVHVTLRLRTRVSMRDLDFYRLFRRILALLR